ncbi:hypothetical protein NQ317_006639 [Molorchus minor]|uniref:E3 ubiquitin-protein ligase SHPRH first helical domain-containing protein n=1 Tax=Molorchus minor TaxID=1323400 RepID=A0ABQ9IW90_9CUCU|nr:hypothetical protein NQ317_006639 [Molorchus minor]
MDRSTLKKILAPFVVLRHACTHPNTLRGRYLATKKQLVFDYITQMPQDAIGYYREALQLAAQFSDDSTETKLTIDKLKVIHVMHNLAEVLDMHVPSQPTLRDSTFKKGRVELEQKQ